MDFYRSTNWCQRKVPIVFSNWFSDKQSQQSNFQQSTLESLQALISDDPTDAMNPIFQDILDQYVNIMNMSEEQLTIHAAEMNLHNNASLWVILSFSFKVFVTKSLFNWEPSHFLYAINVHLVIKCLRSSTQSLFQKFGHFRA